MFISSIVPAVEIIRDEFTIEVARSSEQLLEAYRLRNQVYCRERGYFPDEAGLEIDEFDIRSHHALLRVNSTGDVVGTVRLVLASAEDPADSFPMQRVCPPLPPSLPLPTTAEISRFAISKLRRTSLPVPLMRLALMKGIVQMSSELKLTHWCAVMEPPLLRLLQATGIHFAPLGPMIDYHGQRQPCQNPIDTVMAGIEREQPVIWDFLTNQGALWPSAQPVAAPGNDALVAA